MLRNSKRLATTLDIAFGKSERGWYTFLLVYDEGRWRVMGSSRWTKVLRFVLVLAAVAILLAYIAPIKAC